MVDMMNATLSKGRLEKSQKLAVVKLVPKKSASKKTLGFPTDFTSLHRL